MVLFRNGDHPLLYISWYLGTYFMRSSLYFFSLTEVNQKLLKNFDAICFSIWSIFKTFLFKILVGEADYIKNFWKIPKPSDFFGLNDF